MKEQPVKHNPNMKICYDRIVPDGVMSSHPVLQKMREEALLKATGLKTAREAFQDLDPTGVIPAPHMALITAKTWPVGSTLKCRFLSGSPIQQAKVIHMAKIWEQYANIHIEFVTTQDEQV